VVRRETVSGSVALYVLYLHILRLLHFTDKNNEPDVTEENSDKLWKMRNLFEILNKAFQTLTALLNIWL
jgi:hypothetical protein